MKHIKMVLYGEPGVGKSVFASKFPKPFFITTDGNYEWLEEFGAKHEDHKQVFSWEDTKKAFAMDFSNYDTIVVDLLEDCFKWCEYEYCVRNKLEHLADIGYGKGYDATRTEFFIEICKLLGLDKNIVLICHGSSKTTKDRRGIEHTEYIPTTRLPEKVIDMIEGRVRYFLRCYVKDEVLVDGTVVKRRFLSIVPKPNEFGIIRGVNETQIPQDIPLEFSDFANVIKYDSSEKTENSEQVQKSTRRAKKEKAASEPVTAEDNLQKQINEDIVEAVEVVEDNKETTEVKESAEVEDKPPFEVADTEKEDQPAQPVMSNEDKLAAIRAKLAALNKK